MTCLAAEIVEEEYIVHVVPAKYLIEIFMPRPEKGRGDICIVCHPVKLGDIF